MKKFRDWRAARKAKRPPRGSTQALVNSMRSLTIGALLALVTILVIGYTVFQVDQDNDKERAAELARQDLEREYNRVLDLRTRQVESCKNENITISTRRLLEAERPVVYGDLFFDLTHEEAQAIVAERGGQEFLDEVAVLLPYRQCAVYCAVAHTNPTLEKCPPGINEAGDPPPDYVVPELPPEYQLPDLTPREED